MSGEGDQHFIFGSVQWFNGDLVKESGILCYMTLALYGEGCWNLLAGH